VHDVLLHRLLLHDDLLPRLLVLPLRHLLLRLSPRNLRDRAPAGRLGAVAGGRAVWRVGRGGRWRAVAVAGGRAGEGGAGRRTWTWNIWPGLTPDGTDTWKLLPPTRRGVMGGGARRAQRQHPRREALPRARWGGGAHAPVGPLM
jgi:hypothetical protein